MWKIDLRDVHREWQYPEWDWPQEIEQEQSEYIENIETPSIWYKIQSFWLTHWKSILWALIVVILTLLFIINTPLQSKKEIKNEVTLQTLYIEKSKLVEEKSILIAKIKRLEEKKVKTQSWIAAIDKKIEIFIINLQK